MLKVVSKTYFLLAFVILTRKLKTVQEACFNLRNFQTVFGATLSVARELAWALLLLWHAPGAADGFALFALDWIECDSVTECADELFDYLFWQRASVHVVGDIDD